MSGELRTSIMIGGAVVLACFGLILLERCTGNERESDKLRSAELQQEFPEECHRAAHLDIQGRIVEERIEFSRRVAQALIARRLSLWEAATQLEKLDQSSAPVCQEFYEFTFPQLYPGHSVAERYCRRAMALVDGELVREPAKRAAVIRSLNQELRAKFSSGVIQALYLEGGI